MENFEEKYKNALEVAQRFYNNSAAITKKGLEDIFPELAESEDEKLKEQVVYAINQLHVCECTKNKLISWLEKLLKGEQKPENYDHEMWKNCQANYEGGKNEVINNPEKYGLQKPIEPTGLKTWKYIVDAVLTEREGIGQYIDSPWTTDVAKKLQKRFGNIEQKPAWSEEDDKILQGIWDEILANKHEAKECEWKTYDKFLDWLDSLKERCLPPKPEWSEEDEDDFKHLMDEIVCLGNSRNSANRLHYDRLIKFLDELKNRIQPREEWCDKDERMLDRLIAYFEKRVAFTDEDNPRYANWLKSLKDKIQPKQEWSEQEQVRINRIVACLENLNVADNDILLKDVDWLKSLRPQNRWKPSAFHLECIEDAIAIYEERGINAIGLKEILEELKKLKN